MPSIECMGESFEVHPTMSFWALNDFAEAMAMAGDDVVEAQSFKVITALIKDCIVAEDWQRFEAVTRAKRASVEDLMSVVTAMTAANAQRPTGRPSDSSDGPEGTALSSGLSAADKALAASGLRPDQKLAILRAREVA
jgi:hypothetical protein